MSRAVHFRLAWCAAACLFSGLCAYGRHTVFRPAPALSPFEHAERLHAALEEQPQQQRTWRDYERVLDAYRFVYHDNPASAKADASIAAVAGLLAEEGRLFRSGKSLHDAIAQYEFLHRQYPASRYRASALLAEGEIYRGDLNDPDRAKATFQKFLKTYPRDPLAGQARIELKEIREEKSSKKHKGRREIQDPSVAEIRPATEERPEETSLPAPVLMSSGIGSGVGSDSGSPSSNHRDRPQITAIRDWSTANSTRIAINLDAQVQYRTARISHPDRIYFDLHDARLSPDLAGKSIVVTDDGFLKRIRAAQYSDGVTRIVLDVTDGTDYSAFYLPNPWRLIIDIHGDIYSRNPGTGRDPSAPAVKNTASLDSTAFRPPGPIEPDPIGPVSTKPSPINPAAERSPVSAEAPGMREAQPEADGDRSLARTLGLKIGRIVIDAGHGGHDSGTLGPGGLEEKDIALDVSLRLGRLLKQRLGADVIYTRDDDTFIPLQMRTAIANRSHADLFISIHANSSSDPSVRGVESYYLNFTTSPEALEVAARENAVSDDSIYQLSDLVKKITLRDKIEESREFAADVQQSLYNGLEAGNPGLKDRGVKKAPFVVLIGANMPSILAEISFLTNPEDARELRRPSYRERIAESLYRGVARYIDGLNGVRLAQNGQHPGN